MQAGLFRVKRLSRAERRAAAETIARAFAGEAIMDFYFADASPRAGARRHERIVSLMTFALNHGLLYGEVYATSARYEGLAIWYPPTYTGPSMWKDIRSGGLALLFKTGFRGIQRMNAHIEYSLSVFREHLRQEGWKGGGCWELWLVAVAPEHQKRGYASRLIRPVLDRIDREGTPCYLDTQREENLALYEHFGFEIVETGQLPSTDIPHWLLKREPGAATRAGEECER
jgi:GNAT superfamily N-acetyltransferase